MENIQVKPIEMTNGSPVNSNSKSPVNWNFFGSRAPKSEIQFFVQVVILYSVIIASIVNLSIYKADNEFSKVWISLLSGCLGLALPNPSIKHKYG